MKFPSQRIAEFQEEAERVRVEIATLEQRLRALTNPILDAYWKEIEKEARAADHAMRSANTSDLRRLGELQGIAQQCHRHATMRSTVQAEIQNKGIRLQQIQTTIQSLSESIAHGAARSQR